MLARRGFLLGLCATLAAPAIVRASSLMPVRAFKAAHGDLIVDVSYQSGHVIAITPAAYGLAVGDIITFEGIGVLRRMQTTDAYPMRGARIAVRSLANELGRLSV